MRVKSKRAHVILLRDQNKAPPVLRVPCRGCEVHSSECHTVPEKGGVKYIVCNISSVCYANHDHCIQC